MSIIFENDNHNNEIEDLIKEALLSDQKSEHVRNRKYISVFVLSHIEKVHLIVDNTKYGKSDDWLQFKEDQYD